MKDEKHKNIKETMNECEFDYLGLAEINRNWSSLKPYQQWQDRTCGWWECSKQLVTYNKKEPTTVKSIPGGVIGTLVGDHVHKVTSTGHDNQFGRWNWMTQKGSNNITTTIITAY